MELGQPRRVAGAFRDITVCRRVVETAEASVRRLRKLFQYSHGPTGTHDHEGALLPINPASNCPFGKMIGRPLTDFIRAGRDACAHDYRVRIARRQVGHACQSRGMVRGLRGPGAEWRPCAASTASIQPARDSGNASA